MSDSPYIPIGVDVDEQSFQDLNRNVDIADANLGNLVDTSSSIGQAADDAGNRLNNAFAKLRANVDDNITSLRELRSEVQGLGSDSANVNTNSGDGGDGGGGFGNITGLRRTGAILNRAGLGAVGVPLQDIGGALQVQRTLGQITDGFKDLADAGGPATDVVKSLGGEVGVLATAGGLAVVAIGGIVLAAEAFKSELDTASKGLGDAVTQVDDYYKAIAKGTTDSLTAQLKADEIQQKIDQDKVNTLQNTYNAAHPQELTGNTSAASAIFSGIFSDISSGGKQLNKDLEDSKKALDGTSNEIIALNKALGDGSLSANDAAEAEKKLQAARDATADKNIQIAQQTAQLEATGTSKGIQDRVSQIETERKAITDQIATGELSVQKTDALNQRLRDLASEEERDTVVIEPLIKAREDEIAAIERASKAVTDHADAVQKQEQSQVAIVDKYNSAVQTAEDTAAQARITANQKLQDALVSAAQKASDAAEQALDALTSKQAANLQSLDQDLSKQDRAAQDQRLNDQIKAQRQEASDLQTHLQNLQQIRDANQSQERDDLLNRNFRDLFSLSEQKSQDMTKENNRYTTQQQQREQSLQQQEDDQSRADATQRRERLITYQIQQEDAQKNYQQALIQANDAHTKAIQLAESSYQTELTNLSRNLVDKEALLRQGAVNELKLTAMTEDARMQIFNNTLDQANKLLGVTEQTGQSYLSHGQSRVATPFAGGGYTHAGDVTLVNDAGNRESFNNSQFPAGLGIFIPAQSGYISPGGTMGKGQSMNNTFYIQSNDVQGVRREVMSIMKELV